MDIETISNAMILCHDMKNGRYWREIAKDLTEKKAALDAEGFKEYAWLTFRLGMPAAYSYIRVYKYFKRTNTGNTPFYILRDNATERRSYEFKKRMKSYDVK